MRFIADLHIHSRFSRATSRQLNLPELHGWAQEKGIYVVGTGDITHPAWLEEIAEQLVPAEEGLFRLRPDLAREADARVPASCRGPVRFVLQGEISSIYKHDGAVRKVHNLVYCPGMEPARRLMTKLDRMGNVRSDGRPILGLSSRDVLEVLLEAGDGTHLIPAHVWTPWFSVLGSKSGYDSVDACFGDLAAEIFAVETGLSSDPPMNWRLSALDRWALVSNSDAHSGKNLGREANEFDLDPSYAALFDSLRQAGDPRFRGTIEFFPEHGKYHLDGHRKCGQRLTPKETLAAQGRCPTCGGKITVGVFHRVEELADRPEGFRPESARPFASLVPLAEVLAECFGVGSGTKRVHEAFSRLLAHLGPELFVLRHAPLEDLIRVTGPLVAEAIRRVRDGRLKIAAGYDGEFGKVRIFDPSERAELGQQGGLFVTTRRERSGSPEEITQPPPDTGRQNLAPLRPDEASRSPTPPGAATTRAVVMPLFPESESREGVLGGLNPEQREAVLAPAGPLAIVAGPGTGKTRTLTHRIAHKVLSGAVVTGRVLAVTFTNRAAAEMQERLGGLLGATADEIEVLTLHRLGLTLLRHEGEAAGLPRDFTVLGEEEGLTLLRQATSLSARDAVRALAAISLAKRGGADGQESPAALEAYTGALAGARAVDLDDLITRPVRLLELDADVRRRWQQRFAHVAVDEFQDLDRLQYRFLSLLAPGPADVTVIGDPEQSIYSFRGADPALFARFLTERPGAREVALTSNYRSTPTILEASGQLMNATGSEDRTALVPFLAEGPRVHVVTSPSARAEADFVVQEVERLVGGTSHRSLDAGPAAGADDTSGHSFGDFAVLFRLKAQQGALEESFAHSGMPYRVVGGEKMLARGRGRDVLRSLRRAAPEEPAGEAVRRVLRKLKCPLDEPIGSAWLAIAAEGGSVRDLLERFTLRTSADDFDPRAEGVALLTLHAAKGLEFPVVFLTGCEEGILPYLREDDEDPQRVEEERRLLYVGMTRARHLLYLTRASERALHGAHGKRSPSRFLSSIEDALVEARQTRGDQPKPKIQNRQLRLF
jgi:DNA helicase-2/ATP-dependent DNA helicase PcrA